MEKIKQVKKFSMGLYIIAIFLIIYTLFSLVSAQSYIGEQIKNGLKASENMFAIINYYMVNCGTYVIYALLLFAIGKVYNDVPIQTVTTIPDTDRTVAEEDSYEEDDTAFDDWNKVES